MNLSALFSNINAKSLAAPSLVIMMLSLMILPIPPFALDIFFTFNISISIIVLLTALYSVTPLDFMVFPAILLLTTILRLSLNVASTRIVLTEGHNGPDAAGKVIEAFGHFLIGGNYLVGLVVFVILTIINFMVITKGAGRIAEVGARFALDAMPGKQMAIDADLNAGLITEPDARSRRKAVAQEAEFYGAMDGASKYVRGDAVAGIIIVIVNMVGGLIVGMLQHDLSFSEATETYTMLAIGDGLVAQLPSLVISVAAGSVVSRVVNDQDIGSQMVSQLFMKPQVMYITATIVGLLGMIPSMPHIAFWSLALIMGGGAYYMQQRTASTPLSDSNGVAPTVAGATDEVSWQDVVPIEALSLEVGYRLVPLVDKAQNGELFRRIRAVRKKFTQDVGFVPPGINIVDNLSLTPTAYRITLRGVEIGKGAAYPDQLLAINTNNVMQDLPGIKVTDPSFNLPAIWINKSLREQAQSLRYTIVDASTVVATHLNQLLMQNAATLLNRHALQALLDHLNTSAPGLVDDLIPKLLPLPILQKILQNLLIEDIHIRDMQSIIETLTEYASQTQDATLLTAMVRISLGRSILDQLMPGSHEIPVMTLDHRLEQLLLQTIQSGGLDAGIEPGLAEILVNQTTLKSQMQEDLGYPPILLVPAPLREMLARFLRRSVPRLKVLSQTELPDSYTIKVTNFVGAAA